MEKIILTVIAAAISGLLYRLGGMGKPFNRYLRRVGVPVVVLLLLLRLGLRMSWFMWPLSFGIMFGTMSTYFKFGGQEDVLWHNWLITGFMMGACALPIAWATGNWVSFLARNVLLACLVMVWSERIDEVNLEEWGRGCLFTVTAPLLLL